MKRIAVIIIALVATIPAKAVVNMQNANLHKEYTDIIVPNTFGYDLRIRRSYSSRSLHNGFFGFGQCTDPETKLETLPGNIIQVTECGGGMRVRYAARGATAPDAKVIETIMAEVRKRNKNGKPEHFAKIESDLKKDDVFREELVRALQIKSDVKSGTLYLADGRENENVMLKENTFIRTLADGTNQRFDMSGQLTHMYDKTGNFLKMIYEKDKLVALVDNNGRRINFTYNPSNGKVSKATAPNGLTATYKYKDEDLIEVTNGWGKTFKYKYNDLHNLVRIDFPDNTHEIITYNDDKDWVTSFRNRKGCVESYNYGEDKEDPLNHYWSTVEKKCDGKLTNQSKYEFFHQINPDGQRYLHRAVSENNGESSDIIYHPVFGKPVSVVRNNIKVTYDYYDNGLVRAKNEQDRTTNFTYKNACKKVSEISSQFFTLQQDPKTKKTAKKMDRTVATRFTYDDKKCTLVSASNSDGQNVRIAYDQRGRIAQITDQAKKIVQIKYEERFGKPEFVTRPGLGTIQVKYKGDGEIENVVSKEGPMVAVQVANIFNTLLDLIAPATAEANL